VLNPPIPGPWPRIGIKGGNTLLAYCALLALLAAPLAAALPSPSGPNNNKLPVLLVSRSVMPQIAAHIADAQAMGYPSILTYRKLSPYKLQQKGKRMKRIGAGCDDFVPTTPGGSCDEYPFATTYEGGSGSSIREVPQTEQNTQGTEYIVFLRANKIQDGDRFIVEVIP
jgi:hypothetical protein